jgi:sialate O-acetylesterase
MKKFTVIFILSLFSATFVNAGDLWLPAIFSDNMVLQRDMDAPVWGKTKPGTIVSVEINGYKGQIMANNEGKWMLRIPAMPVGGPYELKIVSVETKTYKNVLMGDVWFASGQSNMGMTVNESVNLKQELTNSNYPKIRLFTVNQTLATTPKTEVPGGPWVLCDSSSVRLFSAVAYFFGRKIHLDKNIPVGLINSSWGGTPAESWVSPEMVSIFPDYKKQIEEFRAKKVEESFFVEDVKNQNSRWDIANNSFKALDKKVHKVEFDDKDWKTMNLPKSINESEIGPYEGVIWFRKTVDLPKEYKGKDLVLKIGRVDHMDVTYFNGVKVGQSAWTVDWSRVYTISGKLVKQGKNVITVRDADLWNIGGLNGPADSMNISIAKSKIPSISLAGDWKYNKDLEPVTPKVLNSQNIAGLIYNAMVAPVIPYAIKGAIWYQGESNASKAYEYRTLLPTLISDWRIRWGEGNFPFFIVQLANFMSISQEPQESSWAELRESQLMTTRYPNVGMSCTIDIGDETDIHPKNKQDVGNRLALSAEKIAYGDDIVYSGPLYQSMKVEGNSIRVKFISIGTGMIAKGSKLTGFAIAGADKKFYWAEAKIEGDEIVVLSDKVSTPTAVRYAWANNPVCNLYNKEGLPASPFRTDY